MSNQLHHKSKRYEVQVFTDTSLTWEPVDHTDLPEYALRKVATLNKKGKRVRVRDRKCDVVTIEANQICQNV